ncbi:MAG: long-chain fatty acid--CoA ligase [Bacteroidetes bacterium]|nr:MAG: long-chain fatty acid--CoA ligase [Bacteroidota bacterium]
MKNELKLTFPALFDESVKNHGQANFLSFVDEKPLTFDEVNSEVEKLKALLSKHGIKKGDRLAILSVNMPNWGISYLAITFIGAVVVPILPDFHESEIENILKHSGVKGIFVSDKLRGKIEHLDCKGISLCIRIEDFSVFKTDTELSDALVPDNSLVAEDDMATIIYTSGTTGKSKGVMLSHKNICSNAMASQKLQNISVGDRMLSILPMSHVLENTLGFILPMIGGGCTYYLPQAPTPSVLLPAMAKVRPTIMLSVPLIIEKIFKLRVRPKLTKSPVLRTMYKISFIRKLLHRAAGKKLMKSFGGELKFFGIGGAKLDSTVEQFLIDAKFPYAIGYGLTETSPLLAGANPGDGSLQSTGPAIDGVEIKINEPDSKSGEGEIWARGPNVMIGYYNEPEITAEVLTEDGWFKTGDLGSFDKKGYLYIKGRLKNMIVGSSGENIYPEEIESVINNFRFVIESVVVQQKGKLVALVHFNREELETRYQHLKEEITEHIEQQLEELQNELHDYVNARVNKFSQLKAVVVHAEPFEKTATQKIKRFVYA